MNDTLAERYPRSLMNTFGPPRRALVRGEGVYVWDDQGRRYTDLLAGIAVNALGHAHPAILKAVGEQMATLGHVSNFFTTEPQIALAERLLDLLGAPGKVFFTNSGAEANEAAFKLTRQTGRTKVVAATGAFHGRTMGALALTHKSAYRQPFEPLPGDVTFVSYGDAEALSQAVDSDTAAVVLEPIQGEAGAIVPPVGYLARVAEIARTHGSLLWLDEIQSGMGRTGEWFAHSRAGVRPDIVTLAKGLGGGIPIGACIGLGAAGDLFGPGNHGTTFGGNPVATAAALAVIATIEDEGLLARAAEVGAFIRSTVEGWDHPLVADVSGAGLLIGIGLTAEVANALAMKALDAGVIVSDTSPTRLRLAPPLVLRLDEAAAALDTMRSVFGEGHATEATP